MSKGNAIVTGSARGIGKAIALRLAKDGFNVVINGMINIVFLSFSFIFLSTFFLHFSFFFFVTLLTFIVDIAAMEAEGTATAAEVAKVLISHLSIHLLSLSLLFSLVSHSRSLLALFLLLPFAFTLIHILFSLFLFFTNISSQLGVKSFFVAGDVSKGPEVYALVAKTVESLGPLSVMVANAGIAHVKPLLEVSEEEWDRMQAINSRGVFNCYQAAAKQFISQGTPGKIIGGASIVAFKPFALLGPYSVSKFAVRGLTQVLPFLLLISISVLMMIDRRVLWNGESIRSR